MYRSRLALVLLSCGLALVAAVAVEREVETPRDLHRAQYETAAVCARCHRDHVESFGRTFHRTMTREARGADLRAPFAGEHVSYFGVPARMKKRDDGTPIMQLGGGRVPERTFEIALTVGSRRYQQYVARVSGELVRLPWAYHLEEHRWFHMNGAFLTPDPDLAREGIAEADYMRHVTRWNDNCIFCHNVAPNPGASGQPPDVRFASHVEELGVACEACHGPASFHTRANGDPLRRYRLHLSATADPTIVNPRRLSQERSLDVCGRCHGQRITDDVSAFLREGDPFVPGDDLSLYSAPLWRDTTLDGEGGTFASRFWEDGTPRLTAYEYQGVLLSPCAKGGELTCLSCHSMHAGDPRGQLRPDRDRDQLCTQCHSGLASPEQRTAHSRHLRDSARCVDCHMPQIVYGVMASHPSHRIELPEPRRDEVRHRPDACTLCHVDQSRAWAAEQRERLWSARPPTCTDGRAGLAAGCVAEAPADGPRAPAFSQAEAQLLGGDPVERALTAASFGRSHLHGVDEARVAALLLDVMQHDPYPGVRHLAHRSLLARSHSAPLGNYTPEAMAHERAASVGALRRQLAPATLDARAVAALRASASAQAIDIGE